MDSIQRRLLKFETDHSRAPHALFILCLSRGLGHARTEYPIVKYEKPQIKAHKITG
jgi:hypothetical protein